MAQNLALINPQLLNEQNETEQLSDGSDLEFPNNKDEDKVDTAHFPSHRTLKELDNKLSVLKVSSINEALDRLINLIKKCPENAELLWRIGEAYFKFACATDNKTVRKESLDKGIAACKKALNLNPSISDAHKWFARLIGLRATVQPLLQKVKDAALFKKHLDLAFALNPNDALTNHMKGRFSFEAASMRWYEKKAAALIFRDPPTGTFIEALQYYTKAEQLGITDWKQNKLQIAKCQIALGKCEDAVESLIQADRFGDDSLESTVNEEIKSLLEKYHGVK